MLVNSHQHSGYSFLDGMVTCEDIVKKAKSLNQKYVMLCDHGNVAGHIEFYLAAKKHGLIPILGSELYHKDDTYDNEKIKGYHLCVYAKNTQGLHNVWAMSSNTYYDTCEGKRTPNTRWEHLDGLKEGVIATSACMGGAISQAVINGDTTMARYFIDKYKQYFEEFYIELHTNSEDKQHKVNLELVKLARETNTPFIYAVDSHYKDKDDAELHDIWLGCQTRKKYNENHFTMKHDYYMHSEQEIRESLQYLGEDVVNECFNNMDTLLSGIEEVKIDTNFKVPCYKLPSGWDNSDDYFIHLIVKNLMTKVAKCDVKMRGNQIVWSGTPQVNLKPYIKQLTEEELPIFIDNGLSDFILVVADYIKKSKDAGMLVGPGRGSCVSSLVCYLLGITEIDPMGKGLYFSRFLNKGRLQEYKIITDEKEITAYPTDSFKLKDGSVKKLKELVPGDEIC